MSELHFPWIEIAILIPLIGAVIVSRITNPDSARKWCGVISGASLITTLAEWGDFELLHAHAAEDRWHLMRFLFGRDFFLIDHLNAPLIPLAALLFSFTTFTTLRTKIRRFSFSLTLLSQAIVLATFSCKEPWAVIALLALGTIPPGIEIYMRGKSVRVYALHMGLFVGLMILGSLLVDGSSDSLPRDRWTAMIPLLLAVFIRAGIVPFHCWLTDLFEKATFGTALLFVTPLTGAYAAMRLILPIAPSWVLRSIGLLSLVTAVYAAAMALVQKEGRRFFCYLFLSHSALVLVGMESVSSLGLTGALCVWLSVGLGLGGFGLTLRALESRIGRLSLDGYQGLYYHTPNLAMFFVLTGLASVGFPGTIGFVGTEMLVDGAVETYPYIGVAVVIAAALNGIAFVHAYFLLFTGKVYGSTVSLQIRRRERFAVMFLGLLILVGGLIPQPGIVSRFNAAEELLSEREKLLHEGTVIDNPDPFHLHEGGHSETKESSSHVEKKSEPGK
ncbi:MAG: proton-conducting transporter membrane subunit [Planctomycetales bacterium]